MLNVQLEEAQNHPSIQSAAVYNECVLFTVEKLWPRKSRRSSMISPREKNGSLTAVVRLSLGASLAGAALSGCGSGSPHANASVDQLTKSFYVATNGNDSADGSSTHPFRTLAQAQLAMRNSPIKTTTINAGKYYLATALELTSADSNETWQAANGAPVVISGGILLSGWKSEGNGIYSTSAPKPVGLDLTISDVRQTAADLGYDPNRPYITGWRVVDPSMARTNGRVISLLPGDFTTSVKPGATVQLLSDLRYTDTITSIVSVDSKNHTITLADPFHDGAAGGSSGRSASWRVLNDPADLSVLGQFAYDKNSATVRVMPVSPATPASDSVVAAQLSTLITMESVSNVTISGLVFSDTISPTTAYGGAFDGASTTIYGAHVSNSMIYDNTFLNVGRGIGFTGSSGNTISGNTFSSIGGSGISLVGSSNGNSVKANTLLGLGKINVGTIGVLIEASSSNLVDGNTIDGSGRFAIVLSPLDNVSLKDNVISNNVIRNVNQQTNDTGAIYSWAYSTPGYVDERLTITGNRIENTGGLARDGNGNYVSNGSLGIYMDDHVSGVTMTKNVIESGSSGVFLCHGCERNSAENNLIVLQGSGTYSLNSGASSLATQDMNYNGTVTMDLLPSYFPNGVEKSVIVVQLSADSPSNAGGHFIVGVDGNVIGSAIARSTISDFVFKAALVPHRRHRISLQFDNGVDTGTPTTTLHNITLFINNSAVSLAPTTTPFYGAGNDDLLVSDISITHSIMYLTGGLGTVLNDFTGTSYPKYVDPSPGTVDQNLLYGQISKTVDTIFGAQTLDAHSITADPLFTDVDSGDYSFQTKSPAESIGFSESGVPLKP
jgi:parallel beta-helix repeat protein